MRTLSLGFAMLLAAGAAMAADLFTLNVPVQVSHLHPTVTAIRVNCHIQGTDPATGNPRNFGPVMGKSQDFPVVGGAYNGTAVIIFRTEDFSAGELSNLTSVNSGDCHLGLLAGGSQYQPYSNSTGPVVAHQPGTPFSTQVNFTIH